MIEKLKSKKGITLIALVITIVVLIILAGVAITLSLGDNGIFKKASKAKEDTLVAQNEESVQIADATNAIDEMVGSSDRETNQTLPQNNLSTEEEVIGTWIDGKTLYQKTVVLNLTTENSKLYPHNIANVETIYIDAGNTFQQNVSGAFFPFFVIGINETGLVNNNLSYIQYVDTTNITVRAGTSSKQQKAYVTLKYTKTTD